MYETFVEEAAKNSNLNVTTFDVFKENMPHYGQDLFNAFGKLQNGEELNEMEVASFSNLISTILSPLPPNYTIYLYDKKSLQSFLSASFFPF